VKQYLRNLLTVFPQAFIAGIKQMGIKGAWLAVCVFVLKAIPFPVQVANGLRLVSWHEAVNYVDNFIMGELRHPEVEAALAGGDGEVVEVGVNVGITARWWLASGERVRVVGVDMMSEALDYTRARLAENGAAERGAFVTGAVGNAAGSMEVAFDDPLEGTNNLDASTGTMKRTVQINTLDAWLERVSLKNPLLLKLDIEGHAGAALEGARGLLSRVPWVVIETHHPEELSSCARQLTAHGFSLRHFHGRTMWWSRAA
jgi:FkbM family methyltransferase